MRQPLPGLVKTRLAPHIGPAWAASLYESMVQDTVLAVRCAAGGGILLHDGQAPTEFPVAWACWAQQGSDLGARLLAASQRADAAARFPLLFLGSDSPDLPERHLIAAMRALSEYDIALGATKDGGVWCIGQSRHHPALFADIPWSTPATGAALRNRARRLGLKVAALEPWQDVDELDDLLDLALRLRANPQSAPNTRRWLLEHEGPWQFSGGNS